MVPFKLTKKVSTDTDSSVISAQSLPRAMPFMDNQNGTRIITPSAPPNQQRNISGASTALPSPMERQDAGKYVWNRIKLKNSPFPRYRHSASPIVTNDNRIFVTGGLHDHLVYGDTWQLSANLDGTSFVSKTIQIGQNTPPPRVGHASTICGNAFVVFGGDTHKLNMNKLLDDDLYLFNINSYKWTIPQPVGTRPLGRYGHKISIIANNPMQTKLYLFGGQIDETYFNDLAMFDLSSFRRPNSHWVFLKPISTVPPAVTNHTMVTFDNKLWVFGGETPKTLSNETFCYDPVQNDWSKIQTTGETPPPIQEHASVVYKHLMCIFGGKDIDNAYSNDVYFLNLITFKWYKLPRIKEGLPKERSGHSLTLIKNDKLVIMGGDKFDYASSSVHDLHTSSTDQGEGTLLYTLDLSHLGDLCPGIMGESLYNEGDISNFPYGKSANSNSVGNENQEMINILTPKLPNLKTFSPSDVTGATGSNFTDAGVQMSKTRHDKEEERSQPCEIDETTKSEFSLPDDKFAFINKRAAYNTENIKNNAPILQGLAIDTKEYNPPSFKETQNDKVILRSIYDELSSEIQSLHLETQQKELETARHISELEKEVQRLMIIKEASKDSNFQMARFKNLEIQKTFLESRIQDLLELVEKKLSQAQEINSEIAIRNTKLEAYFEESDTEKELIDLERKCDILKSQNEKLKRNAENGNAKLPSRMTGLSSRLNQLLAMGPINAATPSNERDKKIEGVEPLRKMDRIIDEIHETAKIKNELMNKKQKLTGEKTALQADLLAKNDKLEALKKIFDGSSKSMLLTQKAIDLSRSEREKYKQCTDDLQQQIDKLKNEQTGQQERHSTVAYSNSDTIHRMKLNNLKTELYISKEDRDTLKEEVLILKKRLYTLQTQQSQ
ncbi:Kel2p [Saccharomyces eubayanus]|uniref:Kel2p n=1 Tax=Saccharomyces eubayanus TaxID=1080349 RepID=UPI0006C5D566|nr:KEL2-like protein [Saccharomyces eubayanus]KOG99720.1 KEL2-like protein [Saccharomyces eubayanus]